MLFRQNQKSNYIKSNYSLKQNLVSFTNPVFKMSLLYSCLLISALLSACVSGQNFGGQTPTGASPTAAVLSDTSAASTSAGDGAPSEDTDYSDADYDDKDVQFDQSPPNVLILLADPENGTTTPLANQANTEVILDPSLKKIHLFCSAYYPIKWIYTGQGVSQFFLLTLYDNLDKQQNTWLKNNCQIWICKEVEKREFLGGR